MQKTEATNYLPAFLQRFPVPQALMRAAEARRLSPIELPPPVLDLGCGNGFFGEVLFGPKLIAVGLDISPSALALAKRSPTYQDVVLASAASMPFRDGCFGSVLSNSALEHIEPLDETLREISRVLKEGGRFVFTVPHEHAPEYHLYPSLLSRLGLHRLSEAYTRLWHRVFKEYHFYSPEEWHKKLEAAGLRLEQHRYAHPRLMVYVYDLLIPLGLISSLKRRVLGDSRPIAWLNPLWQKLLSKYYLMDNNAGAFLILVGEKPSSKGK